jgi:hypothetical protein
MVDLPQGPLPESAAPATTVEPPRFPDGNRRNYDSKGVGRPLARSTKSLPFNLVSTSVELIAVAWEISTRDGSAPMRASDGTNVAAHATRRSRRGWTKARSDRPVRAGTPEKTARRGARFRHGNAPTKAAAHDSPGGATVWFFVKSEVPTNQVSEFTEKLANHRMKNVEGNTAYVSPEGRLGFDFIECASESECRQRYSDLERNGLRILEVSQCVPMAQFLKNWQQQRQGQQKAA